MKWTRNDADKRLAGICSGMAEMFDVDVTLVRFVFVMMCLTPFPIITSYLVAWFIVPKKGDVNVPVSTIDTPSSNKRSKEFLTESR